MDSLLFRIVSDHDQDLAACREWWVEATEMDKLMVWGRIQRKQDNVLDELVSRFAQVWFTEMFLNDMREKEDCDG